MKSQSEWYKYIKTNEIPNIPRSVGRTYLNKGWVSWPDFLGSKGRGGSKKKEWREFEKARNYVRNLGLKKIDEWREFTKTDAKPKDIPSKPNIFYKNKGWNGFKDFLGKEE